MRNMKYINRISCVALSAVMVAGCALPVYAAEAKAGISKEETVYVMLTETGAVKSQSVSEHLHSDSGLSGVADESNLQNIVNTQSDATFTQDGTTLHWNTEDTDVYYKGDSTDTPPITVAISYQINGKHVAAADLPGQSGHLTINIALSNNTMDTMTIGTGESAKTRSVCTPFATVLGTMLSDDTFTNVTAKHGIVQSDGGSSIVGLMALPGVKACVNDLLPSQLDSLSDYLVDTVSIEADVTDCTIPSIMVACAADASLLSNSGSDVMDKFDNIDDLQADLDKLTDAMDQLTDGAKQLDDGVGDLRDGAKTLSNGTGTLVDGTNTLKNGTTTLKDGTVTLKDGTTRLKDGANTLNDGAGKLYDGSVTLKDGTSQLRSGSITLKNGVNDLHGGLSSLTDGLNTLTGNNDTLNNGAKQIADAVLSTANTQLKAAGAISEDMTWENYGDVLSAALGVNDAMRATARQQLRDTVKEKTGADLTEEQLNCLIYMTAVAMGNDSSKDLNTTVTEVGGKMNQAATDAAGSIGTAQTALANAGNNPLAVAEVNAVMEKLASDTVVQQVVAAGAGDETTAKGILVLAAQNSTGNLENDLNTQAAALQSAKAIVAPAQTALQNAGGVAYNVPALQNVILAQAYAQINSGDDATNALLLVMAANRLAAGTESTLTDAATAAAGDATASKTAQATLEACGNNPAAVPQVLAVLNAMNPGDSAAAYTALATPLISGGATAEQAALIITMAALLDNTNMTASMATASAQAGAVSAAQDALTAAGGSPLGVANVQATVIPAAYNTIAAGVTTASGETDPTKIALVATMAALSIADGSQTDFTTALNAAGASAQTAQAAQDKLAAALGIVSAAGGNVLGVAEVKSAIDNGYTSTAYDTVAGQTGVSDAATNALLITMACQTGNSDIATALQSCGATLTNANEVQTAMTTANSGDAQANSLMTAFLTKLVTSASSESLKQIEALNGQLASVHAFVVGLQQYTAGVATAAAGAATARDGSATLASGAVTLADGAAKVDDGASTLKDGLSTLRGGTRDLIDGVNTLDDGATKLDDGATTLNSGATDLKSGATKLNDGAKTLYNGTGDLKKGTNDLTDGVNKLNDEGISKLTDGLDVDQLETLKDIATEMKNRQESYTGYAGAPEGVSASVKFVMKTSDTTETTTTTTDAPTIEEPVAEAKTTLWQRFLALFSFGK